MDFLLSYYSTTKAMPRVDSNDTWVIFDTLKREKARKPYEDIYLAINAEINAGKAERRARTEAEWQAVMAKEKVARTAAVQAFISTREWDARPDPWSKKYTPLREGWVATKAPDGRTYYFHAATLKMSWVLP